MKLLVLSCADGDHVHVHPENLFLVVHVTALHAPTLRQLSCCQRIRGDFYADGVKLKLWFQVTSEYEARMAEVEPVISHHTSTLRKYSSCCRHVRSNRANDLKLSTHQVAPEFEARMAEIRAVEDEDVMQLGGELRKPSTAIAQGMGGITSVDESTLKHHDAIFSPAGPPSSCDTSSAEPAPVITPQQPASDEQISRVGSAGVIGAAARARLALTGKLEEPKPKKRPRAAAREKSEERLSPEQKDGEQPLYKTLKVHVWLACVHCKWKT